MHPGELVRIHEDTRWGKVEQVPKDVSLPLCGDGNKNLFSYGLNVCITPCPAMSNSHVEILTPKMMALGGEAFVR